MSHSPLSDPSAWIERWLVRLPPAARVLDLAAGGGRHARLASSLGLQVLAVDRDADALAAWAPPGEAGAGRLETRVADLEQGPWDLPSGAFDAVIVANYLFRPRFALVCGLLAPGGVLIHETFALGNEAFGRPSNPAFLLRDGELFERARQAGLTVIGYESGYVGRPKPAIVQRLCAVRPPVDRQRFALG